MPQSIDRRSQRLDAPTVTAGRGRSMRTRLPFGTFLAVAAFIASLTGEAVLDWYMGLLK